MTVTKFIYIKIINLKCFNVCEKQYMNLKLCAISTYGKFDF